MNKKTYFKGWNKLDQHKDRAGDILSKNCLKEASRILGVAQITLRKFAKKHGYKTLDGRSLKNVLDRNFFNRIDSEEKAYWLGFLYADGYVYERKHLISVCLSSIDRDHLLKLRLSLKCDRSIFDRPPRKTKYILGKEVNSGPSSTLIISSVELVDALISLGCVQRKTHILRFPSKDQVPESLICHFIRGYFDGDGSFWLSSKGPVISFCGTQSMCEGIRSFLCGLSIFCGKICSKDCLSNNKFYFFNIANMDGIKRFYSDVVQNATIYLDRKRDKLRSFITSGAILRPLSS